MFFLKCIYPKSIFAKCSTRACLLSFASLLFFKHLLILLNVLHHRIEPPNVISYLLTRSRLLTHVNHEASFVHLWHVYQRRHKQAFSAAYKRPPRRFLSAVEHKSKDGASPLSKYSSFPSHILVCPSYSTFPSHSHKKTQLSSQQVL